MDESSIMNLWVHSEAGEFGHSPQLLYSVLGVNSVSVVSGRCQTVSGDDWVDSKRIRSVHTEKEEL